MLSPDVGVGVGNTDGKGLKADVPSAAGGAHRES